MCFCMPWPGLHSLSSSLGSVDDVVGSPSYAGKYNVFLASCTGVGMPVGEVCVLMELHDEAGVRFASLLYWVWLSISISLYCLVN